MPALPLFLPFLLPYLFPLALLTPMRVIALPPPLTTLGNTSAWSGTARHGMTTGTDLNAARSGSPLTQCWPRKPFVDDLGEGLGSLRLPGVPVRDSAVEAVEIDSNSLARVGVTWDERTRTFGGQLTDGKAGFDVPLVLRANDGNIFNGTLVIRTSPSAWAAARLPNVTVVDASASFNLTLREQLLVDPSDLVLSTVPHSARDWYQARSLAVHGIWNETSGTDELLHS